MLGKASIIAVSSVAIAVALAPAASADNQSYSDTLASLGFTSPEGPAGLLRTGKAACGLLGPAPGLMFGRNPTVVAELIWEANPMLERPQAAQLVNAAIDNLCPGTNAFGLYAN